MACACRWREHCEKFSGAWFAAVHASIPFIAMLRKAVIMPKYAILFTIAAAVAGQAMGAKIERRRMAAARPTRLVMSAAAPAAAAVCSRAPLALAALPSTSAFTMGHQPSRALRVSTRCKPAAGRQAAAAGVGMQLAVVAPTSAH